MRAAAVIVGALLLGAVLVELARVGGEEPATRTDQISAVWQMFEEGGAR